ncbi:MAG: hypothetical protein Q8L51_03785 [Candidatus Amesbacteria bacterium]|nr:hypothetical protein [Candidatus Amesbacteria bacterium]
MNIWIYIIVYWVWYFWARLELVHHDKLAGVKFFGNLLFGLYSIVVVQGDWLDRLGIANRLTNFNLWLMAAGIVVHHLAVLSQYKGHGVVKLEKIHLQISHILMFVPYGINSILAGLILKDKLFVLVSLVISIFGVLVGLKKVKLWY